MNDIYVDDCCEVFPLDLGLLCVFPDGGYAINNYSIGGLCVSTNKYFRSQVSYDTGLVWYGLDHIKADLEVV